MEGEPYEIHEGMIDDNRERDVDNPESKDISEIWGDVTDPKEHDKSNFRYLVHAINPFARIFMADTGLRVEINDPGTIRKDEGDQTINLYTNPEMLDKRVSLSCSLIDQDHHKTWGDVGLIVESPTENVIITSSTDAGAIGISKSHLFKQGQKNLPLTADKILAQTYPDTYNEVVVLANHEGKTVRLVGFFYKVTENGKPMDESLLRRIKINASRLNLPLIPITEPNPFAKDEITHNEKMLRVDLAGKRYLLLKENKPKFVKSEQDYSSSFIPPEEMSVVLEHLRINGFNNEVLERLQQEHQELDHKRQLPVIEYNELGDVRFIVKRTGYGSNEIEIRISNSGYASRINVAEGTKQIIESMANPERLEFVKRYRDDVVAPEEVESIVREVITNATEEQKAVIERWWQSVKASVIRQWQENRFNR